MLVKWLLIFCSIIFRNKFCGKSRFFCERKFSFLNVNFINTFFVSVFYQLDAQNLFHNKFYFMSLHVSSTMCSSSGGQNCITQPLVSSHLYNHTYRCDDTRGCVMQFWPPDDKHMCSKHVEAWNKLTVKQTFCASSWLITEINILRCTISKTS